MHNFKLINLHSNAPTFKKAKSLPYHILIKNKTCTKTRPITLLTQTFQCMYLPVTFDLVSILHCLLDSTVDGH